MVVDFYSDSCGPCRMIAPAFKKLAGEMKDRARPRGDGSRRRRGRDANIPRRRVAAPPRPRREHSVKTGRGATAAATWIFRGDDERARARVLERRGQ